MNARYARADAAPPASMGRRFAAVLLDAVAWLVLGGWIVVAGVIAWARAEPSTQASDDAVALMTIGLALTGALVVTQWILHGRLGWTLGRLATGVRTLDVESRQPIGIARIFVRFVVVAAGAVVALLGALVVLLSPFFDRTGRNRGWHDRAAGDEVLDVRRSVLAAAQQPPRRSRPSVTTASTVASTASAAAVVAEPTAAPRHAAPVPAWASIPRPPMVSPPPPSSLVLAPVAPRRSGPDLDTRAIPVVRPGLSYGLAPELEMTRPAPPRTAAVLSHPPVAERMGAEFELSDGRRVSIERIALVGRNPASDAPVQLVRVADPGRSVSKTHLQIGVERTGVWVADRGSTNGTVVTLPDGGQVICGVDQQVRLRVGSTVLFGDCSMRLVWVPGTGLAG
ncbi:RDD family protein [Cellulomonas sp. URHD0024]|uniref:RDD family protein n=1 Tax=Cellulomonas sp. URHD0024 TaxID=1302620 RepID=UPI0004130FEC|nr:RDD family protein [Cellulomonas sp. URHD0024]